MLVKELLLGCILLNDSILYTESCLRSVDVLNFIRFLSQTSNVTLFGFRSGNVIDLGGVFLLDLVELTNVAVDARHILEPVLGVAIDRLRSDHGFRNRLRKHNGGLIVSGNESVGLLLLQLLVDQLLDVT